MHTIDEVNAWEMTGALARLGHLYEHSPWIVEAALNKRPFDSVEAFHTTLAGIVLGAPREQQVHLIRLHPDLVGRAALSGTLTAASTIEQQVAGLGANNLTDWEKQQFAEYNRRYTARFGFPFVICARENRKQAILDGFALRLGNDPDAEVTTALREINRIAWYRLTDLVS
jgi:2-oxo-4-hydroxy-4-carboxy-5-ureidoimidazoline decarboxylase